MNDEIDYVDRPRPGLGVWLALALSLLTTVAIWHWLRDDLPIRVVLPILGLLVLWEIVSTLRNEMRVAYGWTRDGFAVRRGGYSRVIPFVAIEGVEHTGGVRNRFSNSFANRHTDRLVIHLVGTDTRIVITPTNSEKMRDEILRRRDAARRNSR